jgi:hypothetical protein
MSIVEKLTEGIVRRDLAKEGAALLNKWERTGLLEGLDSDYSKNNMASLLENQAKELLREASLMSSGDVEGLLLLLSLSFVVYSAHLSQMIWFLYNQCLCHLV